MAAPAYWYALPFLAPRACLSATLVRSGLLAKIGAALKDVNAKWGHFYVQDSWQVARSLKIDLGLRYEYNQNMTDANNQMSAIDPSVPGGRFVIASNSAGMIGFSARFAKKFVCLAMVGTPTRRIFY